MMNNPLISIVMCTWNGERFLKEQIDSIISQSYRPIELIISDDASTDNTRKILGEFEGRPGVKIFYQPANVGLSTNFDFASRKATGSFIAYSDQDDVWLLDKLQTLYENINEHMLIYSNSELMDESGKSLNKTTADIRRMYTGDDSRGYVMYSVVWGHGMLVTAELLKRSLPIPANIHHDDWLAFKSITFGGIKYHDEVLTRYRQHGGSSTTSLPQKVGSRNQSQRTTDHLKKLKWIELMYQHERESMKHFYGRLLELYRKKENGKFAWPLFFFLLKYRKVIFSFSKKNFPSQLIEISKQSRGESMMT